VSALNLLPRSLCPTLFLQSSPIWDRIGTITYPASARNRAIATGALGFAFGIVSRVPTVGITRMYDQAGSTCPPRGRYRVTRHWPGLDRCLLKSRTQIHPSAPSDRRRIPARYSGYSSTAHYASGKAVGSTILTQTRRVTEAAPNGMSHRPPARTDWPATFSWSGTASPWHSRVSPFTVETTAYGPETGSASICDGFLPVAPRQLAKADGNVWIHAQPPPVSGVNISRTVARDSITLLHAAAPLPHENLPVQGKGRVAD